MQRLDKTLTERYGDAAPPPDELAQTIREHVADLELRSRMLDEIATLTGTDRRELLAALES